MEKGVNIAVKGTSSHKVVICFVEQLDIGELEARDEVLKKGDPFLILEINIAVSSDKKWGIWIHIEKFINANL